MNRNSWMSPMLRMPLAFEAAVAEGGGASAAPAAPAAGGAAPSAGSGNGAGASGGARSGGQEGSGFFFNVSKREIPAEKAVEIAEGETAGQAAARVAQEAAAAGGKAPEKTPEELAAEKAAAEASATGGKTIEELAVEEAARIAAESAGNPAAVTEGKVTPDTVLDTPIFGRFKTIREADAYLLQSQEHSKALASNLKAKDEAHARELATRDAQAEALRAELKFVRETPPFKELTKEEYSALAKEDPAAAVDYRFAKEKHDQAAQKAKDEAVRAIEEKRQKAEAAGAEIERQVRLMDGDKKAYPLFREMDGAMGKIYESLGGKDSPLANDPRAVNLLYRAALGTVYIGLLQKGDITKAQAAEAAKKAAAAAAQTTAGAGVGVGTVAKPNPTDAEQKRWSAGIDAAAPKPFLKFGD